MLKKFFKVWDKLKLSFFKKKVRFFVKFWKNTIYIAVITIGAKLA